MPTRVVAYDLTNGEELWSVGGLPSPRGDLVLYLSDSFQGFWCGNGRLQRSVHRFQTRRQRRCHRVESRLADGRQTTATHRLRRDRGWLYLHGKRWSRHRAVYRPENRGKKSGRNVWAENYWASLVLANGLLYATDQNASTTVFKPSPKRVGHRSDQQPERKPPIPPPAFSDGEIFLRTYPQAVLHREKRLIAGPFPGKIHSPRSLCN